RARKGLRPDRYFAMRARRRAEADEQAVGHGLQVIGRMVEGLALDAAQQLPDQLRPVPALDAPGAPIKVLQPDNLLAALGVDAGHRRPVPFVDAPAHAFDRFAEGQEERARIAARRGALTRMAAVRMHGSSS